MTELLLTPEEVADRLKIGRSHLYKLLAAEPPAPAIRSIKLGKCRRIPASEVDRFVAARLAELDDAPNVAGRPR